MTEEDADYCLGVLPPIYFPGGFAVSEAIRNNDEDRPVYLAVVQAPAGRWWCRELTFAEMPAAARELKDRGGA